MSDKIKGALFYIVGIPVGGVIAFFLYFRGLFYLFLPLALVFTVVVSVVSWKRDKKKAKARIERMYAEGIMVRPTPKPVIEYGVLPKIAAVISRGDNAIAAAVTECVKDHLVYFENHRAEYAECGIESVENISKEELCRSCFADQLTDNNYAVEIDWKFETEDILYNLNFVVKKLQLPIDLDSFGITDEKLNRVRTELDDATRFALREISSALETCGYALGTIEMGSDSYTLFITETAHRAGLVESAAKFGELIRFDFSR